ncbi:Protein kinase-like domain protein [Niveomyces insectorum RCEF 264]|uniref:Protein kinase-like domain protein n=1 Tax=Niveomyces insectorum RCEF 264 TaxID=1081102 RepID=A0A167RH99_9HYPO|nr:Protein kinase-like domain protein [Niveomyces insectorum RCEF 264]
MEEEVARLRQALEQAEAAASASRPQTLDAFLETCHSLSLAIDVVTDKSLTTKGETTNPVGRVYPRRIVPWSDFPARQERIWHLLADSSFASDAVFPSRHQMDYVRSLNSLITSEYGLRYFERDTVENTVQRLVMAVYDNALLRDRLGLRGAVTFESHTNLGVPNDDALDMQGLSLAGDASEGSAAAAASQGHEVVTGLASEILPARDVINVDGAGFEFAAKTLAAAVVTQLFSYMVGKGIRYGYVCTGQTFVFLVIADDPGTVYYYVSVPNLDVRDDDENRLHRTAVAQVFAFILQAVGATPPPTAWFDAAADLGVWEMEYEDVLSKIPQTERKNQKHASPYKAQKWRGFLRSPIRTRARSSACQPPGPTAHSRDGDNDDDDASGDDSSEGTLPPSPTPVRPARSSNQAPSGTGQKSGQRRQVSIQDRPYCTHRCLLGLARGGPVDAACPNAGDHGSQHMEHGAFLALLRDQLHTDRGYDAEAAPLFVGGLIGAMFKLRLSVHGYRFVAKGVEAPNRTFLQEEHTIYEDALRPVQGTYIPVCLGMIDLVRPLYADGGVYVHLLLLSWGGRPLSLSTDRISQTAAVRATAAAFKRIHQLGILHGDAAPRNILLDDAGGQLMVIDFERSKASSVRPPFGLISPNSQKKRKRGTEKGNEHGKGKGSPQDTDEYAKELRSVLTLVTSCFEENAAAAARRAMRVG